MFISRDALQNYVHVTKLFLMMFVVLCLLPYGIEQDKVVARYEQTAVDRNDICIQNLLVWSNVRNTSFA